MGVGQDAWRIMSDNVPQDGTFNEVTDLGVDFFDLLINYPYIKLIIDLWAALLSGPGIRSLMRRCMASVWSCNFSLSRISSTAKKSVHSETVPPSSELFVFRSFLRSISNSFRASSTAFLVCSQRGTARTL